MPSTGYFTVLIPYDSIRQTQWHPTEETGPFRILTRGAFDTQDQAVAWAESYLDGAGYSVIKIGGAS